MTILKFNQKAVLTSMCILNNGEFDSFTKETISNSVDAGATLGIFLVYKGRIIFVDNSMGFNVEFLRNVGDSTKRPIESEDEEENKKNEFPHGYKKDLLKINTKAKNDPTNLEWKKLNNDFKKFIVDKIEINHSRKTIGQKGLGIKSFYNSFNMRYYSHFSSFNSQWTLDESQKQEDYTDRYLIEEFKYTINDIPLKKGVYGTIVIFEPRFEPKEYEEKWELDIYDADVVSFHIKDYIKENYKNLPDNYSVIVAYDEYGDVKTTKYTEQIGEFICNDPFSFLNELTKINPENINNKTIIKDIFKDIVKKLQQGLEKYSDNYNVLDEYTEDLHIEYLKNKEIMDTNQYIKENYEYYIEDSLYKIYLNRVLPSSGSSYMSILGSFSSKTKNYLDEIINTLELKSIIKNGILIVESSGLNSLRTDIIPYIADKIKLSIQKIYNENLTIKFTDYVYSKSRKLMLKYDIDIEKIMNTDLITKGTSKEIQTNIKEFSYTVNYLIKEFIRNPPKIGTKEVNDEFISDDDISFLRGVGYPYYSSCLYTRFLKPEIKENDKIKNIITSIYIENGNIVKKMNGKDTLIYIKEKDEKPKRIDELINFPDSKGIVIINNQIYDLYTKLL
jgi:hypothetical protein